MPLNLASAKFSWSTITYMGLATKLWMKQKQFRVLRLEASDNQWFPPCSPPVPPPVCRFLLIRSGSCPMAADYREWPLSWSLAFGNRHGVNGERQGSHLQGDG